MIEDFRLKVFTTVASCGSFTLAAKKLGISQSAVSQNIAELEKSVGAELFVRSRGNIALTPAGKSFIEYADRILYWYSSASSLFSSGEGSAQLSHVTIAACSATADCLLSPALARLLSVLPGHSFSIIPQSAPDADCRIHLSVHQGQIPIGESSTIIRTLPPLALSSSDDTSLFRVTSPEMIPPGYSLACWSGYSSMLPPELRARVCLESPSVPMLTGMAGYSPSVIALAPLPGIPEGFGSVPLQLPSLAADLHFSPSEAFSRSSECPLLKGILQDIR
ncbi:MAG: LysR family transcriptional regulator [Candidatus Cryptobacteroides sp.]